MKTMHVQLPDDVDLSDSDFLMLVAVRLYEIQKISKEQAALMAGISKDAFAEWLKRYGSNVLISTHTNTKVLFSNEYTDIYELAGSPKILKFLWKETSRHIDEKDYKIHIHRWADTAVANRPYSLIVDTRKHFVPIDLNMQQWFVDDIFPKYIASGIKKLAFLESEDFVSQLSIEQAMDEGIALPFQTKYFSGEAEALLWLVT